MLFEVVTKETVRRHYKVQAETDDEAAELVQSGEVARFIETDAEIDEVVHTLVVDD